MKQIPPISAPNAMHGYWAEARGRRLTELAPPSVNLFISSSGSPYTRPGFEDTAWDLNNASHASNALWVSEYNVSVFASNTKLIVIDHEKLDAVYDTGLTLTADTSLSYYNGAVYATNPTDGVYRLGLSRVDTAASAAATALFVEDGTTYRFDTPSGTLRVKGTAEAYTGRDDTTWKFTGMSLSQAYASGDLVMQTKSLTGIEKFQKIVFWEEAMHGFGPQTATSNQTSKRTLFYGKFASTSTWTDVETFTGGASGSQTVGKKGVLKNAIALQNYLYLFTADESYSIAVSSVDTSTGARPPHLFSPKYGTINDKCAADMDGRIVFITQNRRIIRSQVNQGGLLEPDETFDAPMRNLLKNMDDTQSFALAYYWEEANYLLCQLTIEGQITTLIYDNNPIITADGTSPGRWLPPVTNWQVKSYYTKQGKLYGTDLNDDTVYLMASSQTDDGADIESVWAAGIYEIDKGRSLCDFGTFEVSGGIAQGTTATFTPMVSEEEGKPKELSSEGLNFTTAAAIAQVIVGQEIIGGSTDGADFANFDKSLLISPSKGRSFQPIISSEGDGFAFRVDSWRLPKVKFYSRTVTTTS
jgi:hypothetical protein